MLLEATKPLRYALALLLLSTQAPLAAAQRFPANDSGPVSKKLSLGNLRKLTLRGARGRYTLNGCTLRKASGTSVDLATTEQAYKVRVTFLETVLISKSRPVSAVNEQLIRGWANTIPLVAQILNEQDSIGSMKPVVYDLIEPERRQDLELQEELVLLWSADPSEKSKIGLTKLLPPVAFPGQLVDIQYRGLKGPTNLLFGKIVLQILYVRDQGRPATLGAFVIVSKPSGEYEFYEVPQSLLNQIVIESNSTWRAAARGKAPCL